MIPQKRCRVNPVHRFSGAGGGDRRLGRAGSQVEAQSDRLGHATTLEDRLLATIDAVDAVGVSTDPTEGGEGGIEDGAASEVVADLSLHEGDRALGTVLQRVDRGGQDPAGDVAAQLQTLCRTTHVVQPTRPQLPEAVGGVADAVAAALEGAGEEEAHARKAVGHPPVHSDEGVSGVAELDLVTVELPRDGGDREVASRRSDPEAEPLGQRRVGGALCVLGPHGVLGDVGLHALEAAILTDQGVETPGELGVAALKCGDLTVELVVIGAQATDQAVLFIVGGLLLDAVGVDADVGLFARHLADGALAVAAEAGAAAQHGCGVGRVRVRHDLRDPVTTPLLSGSAQEVGGAVAVVPHAAVVEVELAIGRTVTDTAVDAALDHVGEKLVGAGVEPRILELLDLSAGGQVCHPAVAVLVHAVAEDLLHARVHGHVGVVGVDRADDVRVGGAEAVAIAIDGAVGGAVVGLGCASFGGVGGEGASEDADAEDCERAEGAAVHDEPSPVGRILTLFYLS
jgi:hypothetical protein